MSTIHEKLCAIQSELNAPKGQTNAFGKYKYRSNEDILESVKPLLLKNKCSLVQSDIVQAVEDRIYVCAKSTLTDVESGECVSTTAFAREALVKKGMDDAQITGSASSYARKYSLNGLFAIDDSKDPDSTNTHGKDIKTAPQTPQADDKQWLADNKVGEIVTWAKEKGLSARDAVTQMRSKYKISTKNAEAIAAGLE